MSGTKTYYIRTEDCLDIGWAYEIDGGNYDGDLIIDVDKPIFIKGDQRVKGNQRVKGSQIVEGDQRVNGYQRVKSYQIVKGDQRVEGEQRVEGSQIVNGYQIVKGGKAILGHCKWGVYYTKKSIKIGCKTKLITEWEEWFKGDDVFETPRDSLAFNQIYKTFRMAVVAAELDKGFKDE